jgi:hypothetical protein
MRYIPIRANTAGFNVSTSRQKLLNWRERNVGYAIIEIAIIRLVIAGNQDCIVLGGAARTALRTVCSMLCFWTSRRGYRGVSIPCPKVWARGISICHHGVGDKDLAVKGDVCHRVASAERQSDCGRCQRFWEERFRGASGGQVEHLRACGHGTKEIYLRTQTGRARP